jgi:Flp pilus assembly protein TadG
MRARVATIQRYARHPASLITQRWRVSYLGTVKPTANSIEQGQALVEFALVLMFIILPFTFVLVDGAMMLFTLANVSNAAREGARGGSIYQTTTPPSPSQSFADQVATIDAARLAFVRQSAQQMLGPLVTFNQCTTTIAYRPNTPEIGNPYRELDSITLTLACPRRLLFGLVNAGSITLTSQPTMRIEPGGVAPDDD